MLWPFCNSFMGIVISTHVGLVQVPFIIGKALELLYVQYTDIKSEEDRCHLPLLFPHIFWTFLTLRTIFLF